MKKGFQLSAAAVLALSAITPVAAAAAENTEVAQGVYTTDSFTSIEAFKKLKSAEKGKLLMTPGAVLVVGTDAIPAELIVTGSDKDIAAGSVDVEKYQKDNNVTFDPEKGIVPGDTVEGDLKVESVSAINLASIKVTFNKATDSFDVADLSATGLTFSNAVLAEDGLSATVQVKGAKFGETHNISVAGVTEPFVVSFGTVNDYYDLVFEFDTEDSNDNEIVDIPATGAETVQVTAKVVDKQGNPYKTTGVVRFATTRGGLAQDEVTLKDGVASIQLTSEAATELVLARVSATIVGDYELEGLTDTALIEFIPKGGDDNAETITRVPLVHAETNQADRVFVTLGTDRKFSEAELYALAGYVYNPISKLWTKTGSEQIEVYDTVKDATAKRLDVIEVKQNGRILEVILDSVPTTGNAATNYLNDNAEHYVKIPASSTLLLNDQIPFVITDTTKQFVLNAKGVDQRTLEVKFSEPVAWGVGTEAWAGNNPDNYLIDGVPLSTTVSSDFVLSSDRKTVTINLTADDALKRTKENLEVKNVGDWAGITDAKNRISTQRLEFPVTIDTSKPTFTVDRQSTEQFVLNFSQSVKLTSPLSDLNELVRIAIGEDKHSDAANTDEKPDGILDTPLDADVATAGSTNGFTFTAYKVNKTTGVKTEVTAGVKAGTSDFDLILVEKNTDWTITDNDLAAVLSHWTTHTPLQFSIAKNAVVTTIGNKNDVLAQSVNNERDRISPKVAVDEEGNRVFKQDLETVVYSMNEPVQVVSNIQDINISDGTGVAITPNEEQANSNGGKVQTTEINFEKDGVVVPGVVTSIDDFNYEITAEATYTGVTTGSDDALKAAVAAYNLAKGLTGDNAIKAAGKWTVSITGTPDDYGNTMATEEFKDAYEVDADPITTPSEAMEIKPFAVYAKYYNDSTDVFKPTVLGTGDYDLIQVKFSEVMKNSGAKAVGDTTNYVLNGKTLAELGSSIQKGIAGVTNDWDGITIRLPKGTLGKDESFVLTLASNFESADNEKLTGANELNLVDDNLGAGNTGNDTSSYNRGIVFSNSADYLTNVKTLLTSATVTDAAAANEELNDAGDKIELTFDDATLASLPGGIAGTTAQVSIKGVDADGESKVVVLDAADVNVAAGVVTLDLEDAGLRYELGDRLEVKVNGQTVYVTTAAAPVVLSDDATVTSTTYTVSNGGTANETITGVPAGTSKAAFLAAITEATGSTVDDTNLQDPVVTGNTVVVTAEDGVTVVTYTVTVAAALSSDATVTSTTYTVSNGGTANETITGVPAGTSKAAFLAAITEATGSTVDDTNLQDPVVTGNTVVVTAEDGVTVVTYTVTVTAALSNDTTLTVTDVAVVTNLSGTVLTVAPGTFTQALVDAIAAPANGSVVLQNADGSAATLDASTTPVVDTMKVVVTAEDGTQATYTITL